MDDMNAFERQVVGQIHRFVGPSRPVDDAAIYTTITATSSPKWRFQSMFSATKFVVAGAIVALFGGFLLAGVLTTQPSEESVPAVGASASATTQVEPTTEATRLSEATSTAEPLGDLLRQAGSLTDARRMHTATTLSDGRVLVVGGFGPDNTPLSTAEVWDPVTETFSPAGKAEPRADHGAALLADGRVLVMGGRGIVGDGFVGDLSTAEVWDPDTESFSPAGSLLEWRSGLSMSTTPLPDGRLLVAGGGEYLKGQGSDLAEIWDPETATFSPAGEMAEARVGQTATLLDDGRVLVVGGILPSGTRAATAEVWDPGTESFSPAGSLQEGRDDHTATRLLDGRVLVAGGDRSVAGKTGSAEVWDPVTESFSPAGELLGERAGNTASLLPDGRVLVVGPDGASPADIWDPATESFSPTGLLLEGRSFPTVTFLPDGRVLVIGGSNESGLMAPAEIWGPAANTPSGDEPTTTTPDLLPGVDLVTEEIAPGVFHVLDDGAGHDLSQIRMHPVVRTPDGGAWVWAGPEAGSEVGPSHIYRLGEPGSFTAADGIPVVVGGIEVGTDGRVYAGAPRSRDAKLKDWVVLTDQGWLAATSEDRAAARRRPDASVGEIVEAADGATWELKGEAAVPTHVVRVGPDGLTRFRVKDMNFDWGKKGPGTTGLHMIRPRVVAAAPDGRVWVLWGPNNARSNDFGVGLAEFDGQTWTDITPQEWRADEYLGGDSPQAGIRGASLSVDPDGTLRANVQFHDWRMHGYGDGSPPVGRLEASWNGDRWTVESRTTWDVASIAETPAAAASLWLADVASDGTMLLLTWDWEDDSGLYVIQPEVDDSPEEDNLMAP